MSDDGDLKIERHRDPTTIQDDHDWAKAKIRSLREQHDLDLQRLAEYFVARLATQEPRDTRDPPGEGGGLFRKLSRVFRRKPSWEYQRLSSSLLFDARWYLERYPDVKKENIDPIVHYMNVGWHEGRDPSPDFQTSSYQEANPDIQAAGINPLLHFLQSGIHEKRATTTAEGARRFLKSDELRKKSYEVELRCIKTPTIDRENALFVSHSVDGRVKTHITAYLKALQDQGIAVTLILVLDNILDYSVQDVIPVVSGLYIRENAGFDFAAWAHLLAHDERFFSSDLLLLLNDSLFGPTDVEKFARVLERVRQSDADVIGLTDSEEIAWHIQSFFLAFKGGALSSAALHRFFSDIVCFETKDEVIQNYEVRLAAYLQQYGLKTECLFPANSTMAYDPEKKNTTLFAWKELLGAGCPFVKVVALRDPEQFDIDVSDWRTVLSAEGYDVGLVDEALARAKRPLPPARSLSERRPKPANETRLAFIGPWNFGNGLGFASRGFLSALWSCDFRLNLHPMTHPFHIHPRVAPTVNVCDFVGDSDIALVHLNPDAWPGLLSQEQRQIIRRAHRVVGLWVWEMNEVPGSWYPGFGEVDEIWAPSEYCADVFARNSNVPVKVVPYVVPSAFEELTPEEARDFRGRNGLPPNRKIILYCFDGSSYLIRKNPFALVSAFDRSKLAAEGWTLVLKTKNMHEAPAQAERLEQLIGSTPHSILLNKLMAREDMTRLAQTADIYASPHCSEGFGLTIAEAMALGKHVVATDYGGSRDFVDATCGYPVDYNLFPLGEDHGHYTAGKYWAAIDEDALAQALRTAAKAVLDGDHTRPDAAKARIAQRLSVEAVGKRIQACVTHSM